MPNNRVGLLSTALLLLLLLVNSTSGQRLYYEPDDWQYIPATAMITSASEGLNGIYFSTYDGLLFFDYNTQRLDHQPQINVGLPSHHLYHVFFDPSTNALWTVYDDGIAFRLATDDTWRVVPFQALPDFFHGQSVSRIGGSFDGIWLDMNGVFTLLNPFTGDFMRQILTTPDGIVDWNTSQATFYEPLELVGWITDGEWFAGVREFLGPGYLTAIPTLVYQDRSDHLWFGTDLGIIFRGDPSTHRLTPFQAGIAPKPVITLFIDDDRIWFADNAFRRVGNNGTRREGYFLSAWDENISSWRYYSSLGSEAIRDDRVNDILRVERQLWLATMNGITLFDTRSESWSFIGLDAGLSDRAVWDLERHGEAVFAATIRGVDRISPVTHQVIPDDSISGVPEGEIYTLVSTGPVLYAGTHDGIYAYQEEEAVKWQLVSYLPATSLWYDDGDLFVVANNYIYYREPGENNFTLYSIPLTSDVRILEIKGYRSYIWLATSQGAYLYDRVARQIFVFNQDDGLPSDIVYSVEPESEWVWFLTNEGVVRFNWRAYFE